MKKYRILFYPNIPVAFFNVNAAVSLGMLGFTVGDVMMV